MLYELNFGDGTSETRYNGQPCQVWVGNTLQKGDAATMTPSEILLAIGRGQTVRTLRQTAIGTAVPRVIKSVTEKRA